MINVLLDSSDRLLAIGLVKDNKLIDYIQYEAWQRQSELMVAELEKILKRNNIKKNDISGVMCGIGPGSYTGLRISLTIAKVMSLSLNIPLYTVSSLQILKDGNTPSIVVVNARSGRSYMGVYENEKVILKDQIMKNDDLVMYIKAHSEYQLCGDALHLGLEAKKVNVLEQMLSLLSYAKKEKNSLGVTPIYLKD